MKEKDNKNAQETKNCLIFRWHRSYVERCNVMETPMQIEWLCASHTAHDLRSCASMAWNFNIKYMLNLFISRVAGYKLNEFPHIVNAITLARCGAYTKHILREKHSHNTRTNWPKVVTHSLRCGVDGGSVPFGLLRNEKKKFIRIRN